MNTESQPPSYLGRWLRSIAARCRHILNWRQEARGPRGAANPVLDFIQDVEPSWLEDAQQRHWERMQEPDARREIRGLSELERIQNITNRFKKLNIPETPFTFETYKAFIDQCDLLIVTYRGASHMGRSPEHERRRGRIYFGLPAVYWSKLPLYLLARCPICGGRVAEAIDTFSLGGLGWWYNAPRGFGWFGRPPGRSSHVIRRPGRSYYAACEHIRALVYGVNLNGLYPDDARPRFVAEISSERPGLLRPFMEQDGSYAVIHTLPVGRLDDEVWQPRYTAYFISYFSEDAEAYPRSLAPQVPDDADFCWPYDDMDYELAPWVEAGKVGWLGDEVDDYPLRRGAVDEFPYATLDGLRGRWAIFGKRLRLLPNDVPPSSLNIAVYQKRAFERTRHLEAQSLRERALRRVRTNHKYFDDVLFMNELSHDEAIQRGHYLKCYYTNESQTQLDRAEVTEHTKTGEDIRRVIYYDRLLPHTQIKRQHLAAYPDIPFDVILPLAPKDDETVRTTHHYAANGRLHYVTITQWDGRDFLEIRKDTAWNVTGSTRSQYDEAGNLVATHEYDAEGRVIS